MDQEGYMHCFCFEKIFNEADLDARFISFEDLGSDDQICNEWFISFLLKQSIKQGAPIIITLINAVVSTLFTVLSPFEKHLTKNDETLSTF